MAISYLGRNLNHLTIPHHKKIFYNSYPDWAHRVKLLYEGLGVEVGLLEPLLEGREAGAQQTLEWLGPSSPLGARAGPHPGPGARRVSHHPQMSLEHVTRSLVMILLTSYLLAETGWVTGCSKIKLDRSEASCDLPGSEWLSWPLWPMRGPGAECADQSADWGQAPGRESIVPHWPGLCHPLSLSLGTRTWHQCNVRLNVCVGWQWNPSEGNEILRRGLKHHF